MVIAKVLPFEPELTIAKFGRSVTPAAARNVTVMKQWTKALETPKHVLLIKSPMNESNQMNLFFSQILREDILLVSLRNEPVEMLGE